MNIPAEPPVHPSDRVSDLIQKLVAAATAEVEQAAHRTRAQAEAELAELRGTIDRLRQELQSERSQRQSMADELAAARTNAARLTGELETERTEKARFAATIETVRLVISGVDVGPDSADAAPASIEVAEADDELTREEIDGAPAASGDIPENQVASGGGSDDHLSQLLSQIEEIYRADLACAEGTSELVARLTANLEYARDAYASRIGSRRENDVANFDRQLPALIDARSGTPFGRHLAMAMRCMARTRSAAAAPQHERA